MLQLPNYTPDSLEVRIFQCLLHHPQTDYFVSLDFSQKGDTFPSQLSSFIAQKVAQHPQHDRCFRAVFQQDDWRIILTFIPLHVPLDPKFYFIHKFAKLCKNL